MVVAWPSRFVWVVLCRGIDWLRWMLVDRAVPGPRFKLANPFRAGAFAYAPFVHRKQKVDTAMGQLFDPGEAGSLRGKTSRERAVARFDAGKTRLAIADGGG